MRKPAWGPGGLQHQPSEIEDKNSRRRSVRPARVWSLRDAATCLSSAAAGSGARGLCGRVASLQRGIKRQQDGGMAVRESLRRRKYFEIGKRGIGCRPALRQHPRQLCTALGHSGPVAADHRTSKHRGGGLPKGAGFHILSKPRDPVIVEADFHGDHGSTQWRTLARTARWGIQMPEMRYIGSKSQNTLGVELDKVAVCHCRFPRSDAYPT